MPYIIAYSTQTLYIICSTNNVVINVIMVVWYKLHGDFTACKESGNTKKSRDLALSSFSSVATFLSS